MDRRAARRAQGRRGAAADALPVPERGPAAGRAENHRAAVGLPGDGRCGRLGPPEPVHRGRRLRHVQRQRGRVDGRVARRLLRGRPGAQRHRRRRQADAARHRHADARRQQQLHGRHAGERRHARRGGRERVRQRRRVRRRGRRPPDRGGRAGHDRDALHAAREHDARTRHRRQRRRPPARRRPAHGRRRHASREVRERLCAEGRRPDRADRRRGARREVRDGDGRRLQGNAGLYGYGRVGGVVGVLIGGPASACRAAVASTLCAGPHFIPAGTRLARRDTIHGISEVST
nr:hypothetical protein [Burkholderia vietnamiensis]